MRGRSPAQPANFVGILYAEDFDDPADIDYPGSPAAKPEPAPPAITQADLDIACAEAVRVARLEWQASHDRARLAAIASLTTALAGLHETAERATLAVAEGTVATMLAMVSALLPHFSREHGAAETRALLGRLLPTIRSKDRITVRVHPDLVVSIRRDVDELDPALAGTIDVSPAALEPGDVKVNWEDGSLVRDSRKIAQAVHDALSRLGLHQVIEAPAKRSMAYAD